MNFIRPLPLSQRVGVAALVPILLAAVATGCGGRPGVVTAPAEPESAVRSFLTAVRANRIAAMGELWGTTRGPAARWMDRQMMEQRLTVIRVYLEHERFEFAPRNEPDPTNSGQRILDVRIVRKGCEPIVPFTVVRWRGGWLVKDVDLAAAGNPARPCAGGATGGVRTPEP